MKSLWIIDWDKTKDSEVSITFSLYRYHIYNNKWLQPYQQYSPIMGQQVLTTLTPIRRVKNKPKQPRVKVQGLCGFHISTQPSPHSGSHWPQSDGYSKLTPFTIMLNNGQWIMGERGHYALIMLLLPPSLLYFILYVNKRNEWNRRLPFFSNHAATLFISIKQHLFNG